MRGPWVWLAVAIAGCGASPAAEARPTSGPVVVELGLQTNTPAVALPMHSLWLGRYECAQGVTALTLTLDVDGSGGASAVFDFGPAPENPSVPPGRYLVTGRVLPNADGSTLVTLAPDRWIAQPPGYVMVGLTATIDASARRMDGRIDHPSCTVLALGRRQ